MGNKELTGYIIGLVVGGLGVYLIMMCVGFEETQLITNKTIPILEQIAINETKRVYVDDWVCRDYAKYYNKTFTEKYPELEVRWISGMDICSDETYCNGTHAYILINGYGGECIVDQHQVACIQLIDIENE